MGTRRFRKPRAAGQRRDADAQGIYPSQRINRKTRANATGSKMNPGITEEAGSTMRALITALAGNPAILALSVANMALLVFMFYALRTSAEYRTKLTDQVLDNSNAI